MVISRRLTRARAYFAAAAELLPPLDSWRGEGCRVASPLDGAGFADDDDGCH